MISAHMATLPDRVEMMEKAVMSIYDQVDELVIALNGHKEIPDVCRLDKIKYYELDNSMGDLAKFYDVAYYQGYIFTIDDDLIYPPDYVETYIKKIDQYHQPVTVHGAIKEDPPIESYYGSTRRVNGEKVRKHWSVENYKDTVIDTGGTGCMGWHSSDLQVNYDEIVTNMPVISEALGCKPYNLVNMGDIWFKWFVIRQGKKIICIEHEKDYFVHLFPKNTIYGAFCYWKDQQFYHDKWQTALWNYIHK